VFCVNENICSRQSDNIDQRHDSPATSKLKKTALNLFRSPNKSKTPTKLSTTSSTQQGPANTAHEQASSSIVANDEHFEFMEEDIM
jgi:hypothetical protein